MSATFGNAGNGEEKVSKAFRSPTRVLSGWFQRSRDNWKCKYMTLKAELKRYKVRVSDIEKSRRRWREQAEASRGELEVLRAELDQLRNQVSGTGQPAAASLAPKKKTPSRTPTR